MLHIQEPVDVLSVKRTDLWKIVDGDSSSAWENLGVSELVLVRINTVSLRGRGGQQVHFLYRIG